MLENKLSHYNIKIMYTERYENQCQDKESDLNHDTEIFYDQYLDQCQNQESGLNQIDDQYEDQYEEQYQARDRKQLHLPSMLKNMLIGLVNIAFISLILGPSYLVFSDPSFIPKDNIVLILIISTVIAVLAILTFVGLGYTLVGATRSDRYKKQQNLVTGYNLEFIAILIIIVLISCLLIGASCASLFISDKSPNILRYFLNTLFKQMIPPVLRST